MINEHKFQGLYYIKRGNRTTYLTKSLTPRLKVYDEDLIRERGVEYRTWNPRKSKLAAALSKGISQMGIKPGKDVLYLGCATGTTPSHISDIIEDGTIFCLDFAPRVMRDIVFVCEERKNMVPIMADASLPQEYAHRIKPVDVVFQDIAQRDQVEIFLKNCDAFLKSGGFGLLAIKAKSIDQKRKPKKIFNECRDKLERAITIVDYRELHPFEEDHCFFVVKKK